MRAFKRPAALLLALLLLLGTAQADTFTLSSQQDELTLTWINPLYEDVLEEEQLIQSAAQAPVYYALTSGYATQLEEAAALLREEMVNRTRSITVYYASADRDYSSITYDIFDLAIAHTGQPDEGDSLKFVYGGYNATINRERQSGVYYYAITYTMTYYTTAAQEAQLTQAVEELLEELDLYSATDYEKVAGVYQWICENITYDYDTLNDSSYLLKYTAYAALVNKTAVCQGYAVLFYRLMLELGVDARVISGLGNGGAHGWNIVFLCPYYYNLDSTWDAASVQSGGSYEYFLKSASTFSGHVRDSDYTSGEFNAAYPMADEDYSSSTAAGHTAGQAVQENVVEAGCEDEGSYDLVTYCTVCGKELSRETVTVPATGHSYDAVTIPATRYTTGTITYTCTLCGDSYTESLEKTAADFLFDDVSAKTSDNSWYYEGVYWAYDLEITNGTSASLFSPTQSCTRAQFATFLYRLAGAYGQDVSYSTGNPFSDVSEVTHKDYYEAILWAYENQITNGTSETAFTPDATITRAQAVTMLYRYETMVNGEPAVSGSRSFSDVVKGEIDNDYYTAIVWAVEQGITNGTSDTAFSPGDTCDRAMMVTYLYRYAVEPL
ncbi:MAG: S-layer homology domain-containing protein [Oscillospiraceae bacterium]|nr:S-layer homology domain-containing protein [Oscillospiraceae bacterium]